MVSPALCIAYFVTTVAGSAANEFIFPSPQDFNHAHVDGSFSIGTTINIQWTTTWDTVNLVIWQDGPLPLQYLPNSVNLENMTSFIWTTDVSGEGGNPKYDLNAGNVFFFSIFQTGTQNNFESQYINITSNTARPPTSPSSSTQISVTLASNIGLISPNSSALTSTGSSTSTSSTLTSTDSSTSTSSILPSTDSSASTSSTSSVSPDGMSTATKTGIGVGVGVGVLALAASFGAGYFFYEPKRALGTKAPLASSKFPLYATQKKQLVEMPEDRPKAELEGPLDRVYEI